MKKETKSEKRIKHLNNLMTLFDLTYEETKNLFMVLKGIEMNGHKLATDYCNGVVDSEKYETEVDKIRERLNKLITDKHIKKGIHLNGDPRGYFLKLNDDYVKTYNVQIERDWGGYGILCPEGV